MPPPDATTAPSLPRQWVLWLLVALLVPLLVNLWVEQQFEASKVWLLRTLVGGLVLLWLAGWLRDRARPRLLPPSIARPLVALLLVLALATALSPYRAVAFYGSLERGQGFLTQATYLLLFTCVATQVDGERGRWLLWALVLTALPITLLGLAQAVGWQPLPLWSDARSPLTTTLGRANFTGAYLALLLPLLVTATRMATPGWRRLGVGLLTGATLLVIALTGARAAWIAAGVGLATLLWLDRAPRASRAARRWSGAAGIGLLVILLALVMRWGIAAGGSIAARWTIWRASLGLLWPRLWLGYGADTLELIFPAVYPPELVYYQGRAVVVDRAHNWLLDLSLSYGVVATGLWLVLVLVILHRGWRALTSARALRADPDGLDPAWIAAAMSGIAAQLVGNLFLFEVAATATAFWLLLAILTARTHADAPRVPTPALSPRWRPALLGTLALVVAWGVWQSNGRPLLADAIAWQGTRALGRGDAGQALDAYARAAALQPHRAAYHVAEGLTAARLGDSGHAERALTRAVALRPGDPTPLTQLATLLASDGSVSPEQRARAYALLDHAITLAPTVALTSRHYADLAYRAGDLEIARVQAQRATELDATDGVAFTILGWTESTRGALGPAERAFEEAVHWSPDSADAHLGLATVQARLGRVAEARLALDRSLALDPTNLSAQQLDRELRRR